VPARTFDRAGATSQDSITEGETVNAREFIARLEGVTKNAGGWSAKCPAHPDKNPSLSITEGSDGKILLNCLAGCQTKDVCAALGLSLSDLFPDKQNGSARKIEATYDYQDTEGKTVFQVIRYYPKDFRQRAADGAWSLKGIERVLFRLPKVIEAINSGRPIFVAEGEKDVIALESAGFTATCNAGGACSGNDVKKWQDNYTETLRGADVIIIADKDTPGRAHAELVSSKLNGTAKRVRVLELPDVNGKTVKDAHDYFAAGGQAAELEKLTEAAPDWNPKPRKLNGANLTRTLSRRNYERCTHCKA
jgi:putative DNA primase/helicase